MTGATETMTAFYPMPDTALKAWFDMGLDTLQFVSSRIQKDLEGQKAMLACKSPEEFHNVQAEFYSRALADYRAQVSRVMEGLSVPGIEWPDDVLPTTKRSYDDVPL